MRSLKLKRSLLIARDLVVTVISHNILTGKVVKQLARRSGSGKAAASSFNPSATAQNYVIVKPNLNDEQALQLAQSVLFDISRWERVMNVAVEGDPTMAPQRLVTVQGTGTSFDQNYYLNEIFHRYSFETGGYDMSFHAKNHSTVSEPSL